MKGWRKPTRLVLGGWLVLAGLNHLFLSVLPLPGGTRPLAVQLLGALERSGLTTVAFAILLAAGALLLARLFVPLALAAAMPVNVGAAYWAVVLERDPVWGGLALLVVVVNAALMLAHLRAYHAMLELRPLAQGERRNSRYEVIYATPFGGISLRKFALVMLPVIAAAAFFHRFLPPIYAQWNLAVLAIPALILLAKLAQPHRRS